jgi:hypothetical protein
MATVVKNFRIKSGLVVEGTTGTINGQNILTETGGDAYILNLVGGATLVKSVDTGVFNVDNAGNLTINANTFDAYGSASTAQSNAEDYADGLAVNYDPAGSAATAQQNAEDYADQAELDAVYTANSYTDTRVIDVLSNSAGLGLDWNSSTETFEINASGVVGDSSVSGLTVYPGTGPDAVSFVAIDRFRVDGWYDANGAAETAEQNAKDYADDLINDASSSSTEVWSAYKTSTEIGLAQAAALSDANDYTDTAVTNLVNGAPALLDTLGELATALQENPDIISDLQDIAAGKQNTLTAGNGIDITADTISVAFDAGNGLAINGVNLTVDTNVIATKAYAEGVADDADISARGYADSLASNYDPAGSANAAQAAAELYADTADAVIVGNVINGITQFTKVNISDVSAQVAATSANVTGTAAPIFGFAGETYRSAKLIVKIDNGTHSQISEFLVALDAANNIAVTEYAIVTTNGALADVNFSRKDSNGTIEINIDVLNKYTVNTNVFGKLIK